LLCCTSEAPTSQATGELECSDSNSLCSSQARARELSTKSTVLRSARIRPRFGSIFHTSLRSLRTRKRSCRSSPPASLDPLSLLDPNSSSTPFCRCFHEVERVTPPSNVLAARVAAHHLLLLKQHGCSSQSTQRGSIHQLRVTKLSRT
jgi:hypothetical protein